MEDTNKNTSGGPTGDSSITDLTGLSMSVSLRIQRMETAIQVAKEQVRKESDSLVFQVFVWGAVCLILLGASACFVYHHMWDLTKNPYFKKEWTWPVIYFTAIRVTVLTAIFTVITFCFKMFRSSLHMYQTNRQKSVLIHSMPSLVHAAEKKNRNVVYNKILNVLINFGSTGILSSEKESSNKNEILDFIEKYKQSES